MKIEDYVEEYKQILSDLERVGIHDPDAARTILQERARDRRMERIGEERRGNATGGKTSQRPRGRKSSWTAWASTTLLTSRSRKHPEQSQGPRGARRRALGSNRKLGARSALQDWFLGIADKLGDLGMRGKGAAR